MKILFGTNLDGCEWTSQHEKASLDKISCGPLGLLKLLETRLGFPAPSVSPAERINEYRKKIEAANDNWCRASFEKAPWQTASYLLSLRDTLIEAGWSGDSGNASERLNFFEKVEEIKLPLSPGFGDRMRRLIPEIEQERFEDWTISTEESPDLFPQILRTVFSALKKSGAYLEFSRCEETSFPKSVIRVIEGDNENVLALQLCRYLKSENNGNVALICEGDSTALDAVLPRYGFGRLGKRTPSRRVSDQVFPAFLKLLWSPFDPYTLCEFLMLPLGPVPRRLREKLLTAIAKEGGKGDKWDAVWALPENVGSEWRAFFENKAFSKGTEIFKSELNELCDSFIKACRAYAAENSSVGDALDSGIAQAKTLKKIIQEQAPISQGETISRELLMHILSSVVGKGSKDPQAGIEVNPFKVFSCPGAVSENFETVIWWNFADSGASSQTYWTAEELEKVPGLNPSTMRKRESAAWENAKKRAEKRLILFYPKTIAGTQVFEHPFLHTLGKFRREEQGEGDLTDSNCRLTPATPETQPAAEISWSSGPIVPSKSRPFSFTQIDTLIKCPFKWVLEYMFNLTKNPILRIPTGSPMIGTLAHKVIEILFKEKKIRDAESAVKLAGKLFDDLLPRMAPEFLQAKSKLQCERTKDVFTESVRCLIKELQKRNLTGPKTECKVFGKFNEYEFTGFIDMVLQDKNGRDFVIDLKWPKASYYEEPLNKGKALQLASYASMLRPDDFKVDCAYFLFQDKAFIENGEQNLRWREIWEQAERDARERFEQLSEGRVLLTEADDNDSPCKFCDFSGFCGKKRSDA